VEFSYANLFITVIAKGLMLVMSLAMMLPLMINSNDPCDCNESDDDGKVYRIVQRMNYSQQHRVLQFYVLFL